MSTLPLWLIIVISCFSMIAKDAITTFLTIANARGRANLAGILNALGTPASVIFYSFGATAMVNGHGAIGWLGLLPVMCIDYLDGRIFTTLGRRMKPDLGDKDVRSHPKDGHGVIHP